MRKHAQSWLIKVIFLVIILVFIFWGVGTFRTHRELIIAKVNGQPIYYKEYSALLRQVIESYRSRFKDFNENWIKRLNLKQTVLDQLIERRLILQEAQKMGLKVSDTELWQRITSYRVFQRNGQFDPNQYKSVLARYHYTPVQFETSLREDMLISRLRHIVEGLAHVSEPELYETYKWIKQKINLAFISFDPVKFGQKVKLDEGRLLDYFKKNKQKYLVPRRIKLVYLKIDIQRFLNKVNPSEREIQDYYEANKDLFFEPQRVCAKHILFRLPPNAAPEEVKKVRAKAQMVLAELKKGAKFEDMAKRYSDDKASAKQGGDLGCFPRGVMVKPFEKAAFGLKKGAISDLVRTRFGYHIIKVYDIKPARTKSLSEVKDKIVQKLEQEKAKEKALKAANRLYAQAVLDKSLIKAAQKAHLAIETSGYISPRNWPSSLPSGLKKDILALSQGEISAPLETPKGYLLCQVVEERPQHLPTFDEVKEQVKADFLREEGQKMALKAAQKVLEEIKKGKKLEEVARNCNEKVENTGLFSPGWIPKVGFDLKVEKDLFSLTTKQPLLNYVAKINGKFYVFFLKERKDVDESLYEKEKDNFKKRFLEQRRAIVFNTWLRKLRERAKIEIKENVIE